jgi:hypothetical protein
MSDPLDRLSPSELEAEAGVALPAKEVMSLLDLNLDLDLALDLAAPIDLAVAANANVAAPIDAAVAANILGVDSNATALADQGALIDQHISGDAVAESSQDAFVDQSDDFVDVGAADAGATDAGDLDPSTGAIGDVVDGGTNTIGDTADSVTSGGLDSLDGDLLNVDVDAAVDADIAAPVNGAVAANANVAAPIDAAVAANIGTVGSDAVAVADQDAIISQDLEDVTAAATANQDADLTQ